MSLKYFTRVSILAVLSVGIVACSSSGGSSSSNSPTSLPPLTEQTEAEKAEVERLQNVENNRLTLLAAAKTAGLTDEQATVYAEANKESSETDAQSALDVLVAEKVEADRIATEKAEAERLQKIEANRVVLLAKAKTAGLTDQQAAAYAEANKESSETDAQSALNVLVAEKIAAEKAEADRIAAEKAEAERLQKIEANRVALLAKAKTAGLTDQQAAAYAEANKESSETDAQSALNVLVAEKIAAEKAEADRIAAEKAEAERLQKIEANRVALLAKAKTAGLTDEQATAYAEANKESSETDAQSALNVLVAEKIAAEKAEADRIAAEKAEAERLQKIEANRVALLAKAKTAGLTDEQATAYAEANKESSETDAQSALNTIVEDNTEKALLAEASAAKGVSDTMYPVGAITANSQTSSSITRNAFTEESRTQTVVYNQPYSVVLGNYSGNLSYNNQTGAIFTDDRISDITIKGLKTAPDAIPTLGNATYTGKAFNGTYQNSFNSNTFETTKSVKEGVLSYDVNFTNRMGSGSITGLGDTVNLKQGTILGTGINSTVEQGFRNGNYSLDFFGKKAEEIAGKVVFDGKDTIGFGGTRGEISK